MSKNQDLSEIHLANQYFDVTVPFVQLSITEIHSKLYWFVLKVQEIKPYRISILIMEKRERWK